MNEALKTSIALAQQAAKIQEVIIDGRSFVDRPIHEIGEPHPEPFTVHTLDAVIKYCTEDPDGNKDKLVVRVDGPTTVIVMSKMRPDNTRECYVTCKAYGGGNFDRYLNQFSAHEDVMIFLQTHFLFTDSKAELMRVIGKIDDSEAINVSDDGVSQNIIVKSGAAMREAQDMENPASLIPRRSFPEIILEQVAYIVRLQSKNEGVMPGVGIFECDGGNWKVDAVNKIGSYLADKLPDGMTLLF